mmetsp:Transcript_17054/g.43689  ORF Transcript_17054/g.43689 Transcript_17054/m.43689 type:complete len:209 (-) Transcript_17054:991-1617(-)
MNANLASNALQAVNDVIRLLARLVRLICASLVHIGFRSVHQLRARVVSKLLGESLHVVVDSLDLAEDNRRRKFPHVFKVVGELLQVDDAVAVRVTLDEHLLSLVGWQPPQHEQPPDLGKLELAGPIAVELGKDDARDVLLAQLALCLLERLELGRVDCALGRYELLLHARRHIRAATRDEMQALVALVHRVCVLHGVHKGNVEDDERS